MNEIAAGKSSALSDSAWNTFNSAIKQAQEKFLMLGPDGNITYKPGVTFESLRDYLWGFANPSFGIEQKDVAALKKQFEAYARDPYFENKPAPASVTPGGGEAGGRLSIFAGGNPFESVGRTAKTIKELLSIPGVNNAVLNAAGPQAVIALSAAGTAAVPTAMLMGLYEATKAISGGATTVPGVENAKKAVAQKVQEILNYLRGPQEPKGQSASGGYRIPG
jgi:hypothetical protein